MKLQLKMQDGKDQRSSVQKLISATTPTKLAYTILIKKKLLVPKGVKRNGYGTVTSKWWRIYLFTSKFLYA